MNSAIARYRYDNVHRETEDRLESTPVQDHRLRPPSESTGVVRPISKELGDDEYDTAQEMSDAGYGYIWGENGFPQDREKGIRLVKTAHEYGQPRVLFELALDFYHGFRGTAAPDYKRAFWCFQLLSIEGDNAEADRYMGNMSLVGEGVEQDTELSIMSFTIAMEKGDIEAMYIIGKLYLHIPHRNADLDNYPPQDIDQGLDLLHEASEHYSPAKTLLGAVYATQRYSGWDEPLAVPFYRAAAEAKYSDAQLRLAEALFRGTLGLEPNWLQALRLCQEAAEADNAEAQFFLPLIIQEGVGEFANFTELELEQIGHRWTLRAAENGYAPAQSDIAEHYFESGPDEHHELAFDWCLRAIHQGDTPAKLLGGLILEQYGDQVRPHESEASRARTAFEWFMDAAQNGMPMAQNQVAKILWHGNPGVRPDREQSVFWRYEAARGGYADAMYEAGRLAQMGLGLEPNENRDATAFQWFLEGSHIAHAECTVYAAGALLLGEGVAKDVARGREMLHRLERSTWIPTLLMLADVYETGLRNAIPPDRQAAHRVLQRAADLGSDIAEHRLDLAMRRE